MTYQSTTIVGRLGSDPELRYIQSGKPVCNFPVAVTEKWRDRQSNEQREETTWYRVSVWGNQAETCNTYLEKGRQVLVIGNVQARAYTNKQGEAGASLDLTARNVKFLGSGEHNQSDGGQRQQQRQQQQQSRPPANDAPRATTEDIPF